MHTWLRVIEVACMHIEASRGMAYAGVRSCFCLLFFATFPQGILASTLTHTSGANFHRLGVVARAGVRGSRAGNIRSCFCLCLLRQLLAVRLVRIAFECHFGVRLLLLRHLSSVQTAEDEVRNCTELQRIRWQRTEARFPKRLQSCSWHLQHARP